jgi:hypothetical protein
MSANDSKDSKVSGETKHSVDFAAKNKALVGINQQLFELAQRKKRLSQEFKDVKDEIDKLVKKKSETSNSISFDIVINLLEALMPGKVICKSCASKFTYCADLINKLSPGDKIVIEDDGAVFELCNKCGHIVSHWHNQSCGTCFEK